jgi:hypothetical protein
MKGLILMATAAAVYLTAAWMVAPGFYDGFTPPQPYNWTSPPPEAPPGNISPKSGHLDVKVIGGVSCAEIVFTDDGQVTIGFLPGAFDVSGKTSVAVDIKPVSTYPPPTGLHFATNVYLITADARMVVHSNLVLLYSDVVPAPSFVYVAVSANGPWKSIGGAEGRQFTIQATTGALGYFAAGYPASATNPPTPGGTSQLLPIAVAVLIVGVLIAAIPLAIMRRRRGGSDEEAEEPDEA